MSVPAQWDYVALEIVNWGWYELPIITRCLQPLSLHLYSGKKPKKLDETQPSCDLAHPFIFSFHSKLDPLLELPRQIIFLY